MRKVYGGLYLMKEKCPCCKEKYPKGEEKLFLCSKCTRHEESCNPNVKELRNLEAKILGGVCFICQGAEQTKAKGVWVVHHKYYDKIKRKDYPKNVSGDLAYHLDLIHEVEENPDQFLLLHNKCHFALHKLHNFTPENRKRLIKAVELTDA